MKIIESSAKLITQTSGIEGLHKHIELCGRVSYKSEDRISESSSKQFVENLIKSGHTSVLEHGTIYMSVPVDFSDRHYIDLEKRYDSNPYSKVNFEAGILYITTNYRVIKENHWDDDLQYMCDPTENHEKRYTVKIITSIGIIRELLRHRKFSFTNESTRYCNYSKNKFNNEITFIAPHWLGDSRELDSMAYDNVYELFVSSCEEAESYYMILLENGFKPQDAREFLPLCTKSELCMTGFTSDWKSFLDVRYYNKTGVSHPDMINLSKGIKNILNF